jgi:hypothetical protein
LGPADRGAAASLALGAFLALSRPQRDEFPSWSWLGWNSEIAQTVSGHSVTAAFVQVWRVRSSGVELLCPDRVDGMEEKGEERVEYERWKHTPAIQSLSSLDAAVRDRLLILRGYVSA